MVCLLLLFWGTTWGPQESAAAPLNLHSSLTLGLHIMETLPLDPRPLPMLRRHQSILPTALSQNCPTDSPLWGAQNAHTLPLTLYSGC